MINAMKNIRKNRITNIHLVYVFLFITAFAFRFVASQKLPINSYEASILLKMTGRAVTYPEGVSIIESLLIKSSFFIFSDNDLAARIWPIIAGSILTLLPLYLENKLNKEYGLMLSLFIAIDPFMVVNSIQIGSNIFAFLAFVFFLGAIWKRDVFTGILNLILLLISGRGVMLAMILGVAFLVYEKVKKGEYIRNFIEESKEWWKKNNAFQLQKYISFGLLLVFVIAIYKIDISLIFSDFTNNLKHISSGYEMGESPLAFGLVFISYLPFFILLFIYWLINSLNKGNKHEYFLILWITIALLFIIINPYQKFHDLLWISGPMLICTSFMTQIIFKRRNKRSNSDLIRILIFLISLIAFSMNFASFIYQGFSGISQFKTLASLTAIFVLITALVIFFTYQYRLKQPFLNLMKATFILLFVIQIGFSFRASGLSGSLYTEVLWAGDIIDEKIIQAQIESKKQTKEFTSDVIKIGLLGVQDPGILWGLRAYDVKLFNKNLKPDEKFDILISQVNFIEETNEKYYGQEFIIDSFPKWSIEPIKSLWFYDYWSWLIFRKSQMHKSFNNIWVKVK